MTIADDERRAVARWSAACATRALGRFEAVAPTDGRPRAAIEGAHAYADGGPRTKRLRADALGANAAAREVGDPVAAAAARAAGLAAATAFIHGEETIGTLGHIVGAAVQAAHAARLAADDDAAATDEIAWAVAEAPRAVRELVVRIPPCRDRPNRLDPLRDRIVEALLA